MRIISGKYKGKSINFSKSKSTRPLKDNVRESIFNILLHSNKLQVNVDSSNILDLYSGIGSFGIECISRGANSVTFVEKDIKTINILKKNLKILNLSNKTKVFQKTTTSFLNDCHFKNFEIIFLDPPFKKEDYIKYLINIFKKKIFSKEHIIIIHREKNSRDNFDEILKPLIIKYYGRSKIIFGKFLT